MCHRPNEEERSNKWVQNTRLDSLQGFQKYGYSLDNKNILWKYVQDLFEKDSRQHLRMCPKLVKHMKLTSFSKTESMLGHASSSGLVHTRHSKQAAQFTAFLLMLRTKCLMHLNSGKLKNIAEAL